MFFNFSSESKAFFIKIREGKVTYKNVSSTKHSKTKGRRYLIFASKFLRLRIILYATCKSIRSFQLLFHYTFIYVLYHWWNHIPVRNCCWWYWVETASFAWDRKMVVRYVNHKKAWKMKTKLCYDRRVSKEYQLLKCFWCWWWWWCWRWFYSCWRRL